MYTVREVTNKSEWEGVAGTTLLQQWQWGEFQQTIGKKIWRLGVYNDQNNQLQGVALVVLIHSQLRSHLYIPNGPVAAGTHQVQHDASTLALITKEVIKYCKKHITHIDMHFIRVDPLVELSVNNIEAFKKIGLRQSSTHVQPEKTILLDLTKTEDELLAEMGTTTRYGVKKGAKDGITVTSSTEDKDFDIFWDMYQETTNEKQFVSYSKKYYYAQFSALKQEGKYAVYIAYENNSPIVASLIACDNESGYYLHTGRRYTDSKTAKHASKVLLWEAIKDAKNKGLLSFNLFGIAKSDNNIFDPWAGFTEFKKGFGGQEVEYIGAFDYPLTPNYWMVRILEKTRKIWGYPYFILKQILKK